MTAYRRLGLRRSVRRRLRSHFGAVSRLVLMLCLTCSAHAGPDKGGAKSQAAMGVLKTAKFYYKEGSFAKAAARFHEAYAIDPRPEFLFNAARSEQRAMMLAEAERDFVALLVLKGLSSAIGARARMHLSEVRAVRATIRRRLEAERKKRGVAASARAKAPTTKATPPAKKPAPAAKRPAPAATKPAPAALKSGSPAGAEATPTWRTPAGWGGSALGVLAVAAGAWQLLAAAGDQQTLDARLADRSNTGIVGIDKTTYRAEQDRIDGVRTRGAVLTGVGVAVGAAGAWLLLTARRGADDVANGLAWSPAFGDSSVGVRVRF